VRPRRQPTPRGSRAASFFLLLGCATVLGGTFATGLWAGRHWPGLMPSIGRGAPHGEQEARGGRALPGRPGTGPGTGERGAPVLTFYQELTAPLTSAPPPKSRGERPRLEARPERTEAPRTESATVAPRASSLPPAPPAATSGERKFTIQVGAFKTRDQAEAVRAKLAAAGHDAYIAEVDGTASARYRVRVGAFATRDEARQVAQRITASTYVTTR
jgi:hypothetical protein